MYYSGMERKNLVKRILMSLFGVIICAISVGIFKIAALGVDPFQSFMAGLDALVPIKFGTLYVIANAVLFIFMLIFDRHYIGIATFINLFLLGYITQFTYEFLQTVIVEPAIWVRVLCLIVGVVIICFGSAFYMTADLGVSTYDAVALIIVNTWKRGKFQYVRIITDVVCVLLGVALFLLSGGGMKGIIAIAGVGTIITAFFMGPLIEFFNVHCARPVLNGKNKKEKYMNETLKVLESRRSCRKFKSEMLREEDLNAIIRAGTFAPTGMNKQTPIIIAVTNKDLRDKISEENRKIGGWNEGFDPFYGAPVILIVLANKAECPTYIYDGSLVMGNLMNAAESLGIGSIWIHRAKEEFQSDFGNKLLSDLGIEGDFEGIGHVALGYVDEGGVKAAAPRKENYVYWVK